VTKLIVYSRHGTTPWWRYIASQLEFVSETFVLSEFRGDGDLYIMPAFYRHLRAPAIEQRVVDAFGEETCDEIIARDRLLRQIDSELALRIVGATWQTLDEIIEKQKPDLVVSFCIDYYVPDILERVLNHRGIPFVGLGGAPLEDYTLFTARGEHNFLREPDDCEIDKALARITDSQFAPTLPKRPRYNLQRFLEIQLYHHARGLAFKFVGLWNRDPLNFYYWIATIGHQARLRDWKVVKYIQSDWKNRLEATPFDRRMFIALPVHPEASTDYWVKNVDLISYEQTLEHLATVLTEAGYSLFIKDHPNMFGVRKVGLYECLARIKGVTFVPFSVPSQFLINNCHSAFTFSGTVGLQAALAGRCPIVTDPYYFLNGYFVKISSLESINDLPERIRNFETPQPLAEAQRQLVRQILRTSASGDTVTSFFGFDAHDPACVERVKPLTYSLNAYLPLFLRG
jgi:hypothetical protein